MEKIDQILDNQILIMRALAGLTEYGSMRNDLLNNCVKTRELLERKKMYCCNKCGGSWSENYGFMCTRVDDTRTSGICGGSHTVDAVSKTSSEVVFLDFSKDESGLPADKTKSR